MNAVARDRTSRKEREWTGFVTSAAREARTSGKEHIPYGKRSE